jgi:transposase
MVATVGINVHKQTHCPVAVDAVDRHVSTPVTVRATDAGHRQLLRWAQRSLAGEVVEFAVEDCQHVSTRLERALLAAAATVIRVPPKLMAQTRTSARTRGKSDPIDALAITRAALREPNLPRAEHTPVFREPKQLVDHREDLIAIRTGMQNRLRWHLHELGPEFDPLARGLNLVRQLDQAQARLARLPVGTTQDDTTEKALRALKRRLARVVFNILRPTGTATPACLPTAA